MYLKPSFYNISLIINGKDYIFNTFRQTLAEVEPDVFGIIKSGDFDSLSLEDRTELTNDGFIIRGETNEYEEYLALFEKQRNEPFLNITLILATDCNLRCIYCYQRTSAYTNEVIDDENIEIFIGWLKNEALENNIKNINIELFGGEPLLAQNVLPGLFHHLNDLVRHNDVNISTAIVTNGTLLTDGLIGLFIDNNVEVKISIDGVGSIHDQRRRSGIPAQKSYHTIISNIKKIIDTGRSDLLNIRMNLDKGNLEHVDALAEYLYHIGVKNFYCGRVIFRGRKTAYDKVLISSNEFDKEIDYQLYKVLRKYNFVNTPANIELRLSCQFHNKFGYIISPTLRVAKCDELINSPEHSIGYINKDSRLINFNNNYLRQVSYCPAKSKKCRNCILLPLCGGGCPIVSLNQNGSLYEANCHISMESLKYKLTNILNSHTEIN